jgi:hypothetical protein
MCSPPADACEESVFGENGDGIEEKDGNIDQWPETEE